MLWLVAWALLAQEPVVPPPPVGATTDPLELQFVWRAPPGCPDATAIEARIRALIPGDPQGDGVLLVEGDVTITESGARLVLVSTYRGRSERREIQAPDCDELAEATSVLIAIALEPSRVEEIEKASAPQPQPTIAEPTVDGPELAPAIVAPSTTTSPARRRAARPTAGALRLAAGLDAGGVPPPTAAVQGAAILEWKRARLELHGVWLVPREQVDDDERGGTYQLGAVGLRGCGRLFHNEVEFPLCLGAEAGTVRAQSTIGNRRVAFGPWVGALASVGVARAWGPVGVWSAIEGLGRVVGSRFLFGQDLAERQWPVSVRALVGIEIRRSWIRRGRGQ